MRGQDVVPGIAKRPLGQLPAPNDKYLLKSGAYAYFDEYGPEWQDCCITYCSKDQVIDFFLL